MNPSTPNSSSLSLSPRDIIVMLFRNKWKIILFTLAGLGAAAYLYQKIPAPYQSTAKLLVKYVMDTAAVTPEGGEGYTIRNTDTRGENVMNVEVEILTSWDLAEEVARAVGPAEILGKPEGTNMISAAAGQILAGIVVEVPHRSSVITVGYKHPRPETAVRILSSIVELYLEKHLEAHRSSGSFEALERETDSMRLRVRDSQHELNKIKNSLGITTVAESKLELSAQMRALETSIIETSAELAQRQARVDALRSVASQTAAVSTPAALTVPVSLPDDQTQVRHRSLLQRLTGLRQREFDLISQFTPENALVRQVREDIATTDQERRTLEEAHPALIQVTAMSTSTGRPLVLPGPDISLEAADLVGSQARLHSYTNQLNSLKARLVAIQEKENQVLDLERRLAQEEKAFTTSESNLQRARFDEALDPSKIPNINVVQKPSVPLQDNKNRLQFAGAAAGIGLALGLGLAFLREFLFDQSIRSPLEIETRFQLPMFLSIPLLSDRQPVRLLANGTGDPAAAGLSARPERAPWEVSHFIRPYCDALRDRLIMYFQLKNIHHKPKLVAVTSCSEGAGTTTLAAALAASLSETGEGKVLLVDMNVARPEMHPFFRGNLASSLSDLFLPGQKAAHGQYDNLFLATGTERNGELTPLVPAKFYEMLPKMRSSDFDYIIFDMPAVKQTSATVALSGFMDKVLLLIEPGKTNREAVKRATELMRQQHADVAGVVNRLPASAMKWLQPELA